MLIITSKKDGFRRCGVAHPAIPTEYADDAFTPEQIETLRKEPMLVVLAADGEKAELTDKPVQAADMIALIKNAGSMRHLDWLAEGETRKTVLEAIEARRAELGA